MVDQNSQFYAILTKVGAAKQANADALGIPWKITHMAVGDASPAGLDNPPLPMPDASWTSLLNEWRRAPLNQLKVDEKDSAVIVAEQVIPAEIGGRWIREVGLYDADGDLVAVANCAPTYKPLLNQGSGRTQVVHMNLVVSSASNVQLKIDPGVVLATREFVTEELAKRDFKHSVLAATTAAITLSGLQTMDGVALQAGARVLVKNQAAAKDNGLYLVASGAWTRCPDADSSAKVTPGLLVLVERGTANGDSAWQLTTDAPITLGVTALAFEMAFGRSGVAAGTYRSVKVDAYGRVIAATNPTTLAGYDITDAYTMAQIDALLEQKAGSAGVYSFSIDKTLTSSHRGLVLLDASAGTRTITLPAVTPALGVMDVILRRVDLTTNALVIAASGTDKILLDTTGSTSGQASTELLFAGDYLCLRNDSVGRWWCVGQAQLPPSIETVITKYSTPGIFTYTVPPLFRSGRRRARVKVTAGGGGGGHVEGNGVAGGGGGGGGMGSSVLDLSGVVSVTVTVGAGGAARPAGASLAGGAGGASSFGELISSTGGSGGSSPSGGITGSTTGQIVYPVSASGCGTASSLGHGGGHGGCSKAFNWQVGDPGVGPGGGGVGGAGTSGARGSGAGAPGEVLIEVA
ncbi:phage tail protein [Pseudomonas qingdaonensis]|uniref:phage tail protein n=1 Tax=Pseudomonas qingdaonensis TaxID=2056231 RepID=UPI001FD380DF|nr:phage tail protein [Pseudomonas qingdaonensis]